MCVCLCACVFVRVCVLRVLVSVCVYAPWPPYFLLSVVCELCALAALLPPSRQSTAAAAQRKGFKIVHKARRGEPRQAMLLCSLFLIVAGHTVHTHIHSHTHTHTETEAYICSYLKPRRTALHGYTHNKIVKSIKTRAKVSSSSLPLSLPTPQQQQ